MISKATQKDLPEVIDLWSKVSKEEFSDYIGVENVQYFIENGYLEQECQQLIEETYIYKRDNKLLGFVIILEDLLELLIVKPENQNFLIGKRLYDFAVQKIQTENKQIRMECFENNHRVNSMLVRLGYKVQNRYQDEYGFMTNTYCKKL